MAMDSVFKVGSSYLFRTVTMCNVGKVKEVVGDIVVLEEASWVADTGRFHTALKTGELSEVEPWADGIAYLNIGALVDAGNWNHPLPKEQK